MKRLALLFGFMVLTSQFSICPYRVLPESLVRSLEYGRQWTGVFLQAYGLVESSPAPVTARKAEACALADAAPAESVDLPPAPPSAELPLPQKNVFPEPVIVQVDGPAGKEISMEIQKEMGKAMQEMKLKMHELKAADRRVEIQRVLRIHAAEAARKLRHVRIVVATATKSA